MESLEILPMLFTDIRYATLLKKAAELSIESGDLRRDTIFSKYKTLSKLGAFIPSTVELITGIKSMGNSTKFGSQLLNDIIDTVDIDLSVTMKLIKTYIEYEGFYSDVAMLMDKTYEYSMLKINDSMRTCNSDSIELPYIKHISPVKTTNAQHLSNSITCGMDIRRVISSRDVYVSYSTDADVTGSVSGTLVGENVSFTRDYSESGMSVEISITFERANTVIIEFNDDIEHEVEINGYRSTTCGAAVFAGNNTDRFNVRIVTYDTDITGNKHFMSISYITVMDVAEFYDAEIEMTNPLNGVNPLYVYPVNEGIYSGYGSARLMIYKEGWKTLAFYNSGGMTGSKMRVAPDSSVEEFSLAPTSEYVEKTGDINKLRIRALFGEDEYYLHEDKKYAYAYLSDMPEGASVYYLDGKKAEDIYPGFYVVEFEDEPAFDYYSHIDGDGVVSIYGNKVSVPEEMDVEIEYESHEKESFTPAPSYTLNGNGIFSAPDLYMHITANSENTTYTSSYVLVNTETYVQPGTRSRNNLMAYAALHFGGEFYYIYPWECEVIEPFSETGEDVELQIKLNTSYEYDFIEVFVVRTSEQEKVAAKNRRYATTITAGYYCDDVLLIPLTTEKVEFEQSEFEEVVGGTFGVYFIPARDYSVRGILVVPTVPDTVISSPLRPILSYGIDGVYKNYDPEIEVSATYEITDSGYVFTSQGLSAYDSYVKFKRENTDSVLVLSEENYMFDYKILIELNPGEGFVPVVTTPVVGIQLR
jgi:hypothetical protein